MDATGPICEAKSIADINNTCMTGNRITCNGLIVVQHYLREHLEQLGLGEVTVQIADIEAGIVGRGGSSSSCRGARRSCTTCKTTTEAWSFSGKARQGKASTKHHARSDDASGIVSASPTGAGTASVGVSMGVATAGAAMAILVSLQQCQARLTSATHQFCHHYRRHPCRRATCPI